MNTLFNSLRFRVIVVVAFIWMTGLLGYWNTPASADLGVGVGTGKMVVEEKLRAGTIYNLPVLTVINTGTEKATYGVGISHRENQPELRPNKSWFSFSPEEFELAPGFGQNVTVTLTLPLRVEPGDYFAFVEGHPIIQGGEGASIGIAAASKLYFTVEPSNPLQGLYYRILSFWRNNQPWTNIGAGVIIATIIVQLLRTHFDLKIEKKPKRS